MSTAPSLSATLPIPNLSVLAAARLAFAFISHPDFLRHDHQLSSPLTSFFQLKEGIYLFTQGINPYSGGTFRHSPLLLALFATILPSSDTAASLLWAIWDIIGAYALVQIWRARQGIECNPRDALVATMYMLNPYILLPSLALSTSSAENAIMLLSLMFACKGRQSAALFSISFLFLLAPCSILLLLPIILLLLSDPHSHLSLPSHSTVSIKNILPLLNKFVSFTFILTLASTYVSGSWNWIEQAWGASLTLPDLTPNPGLWWYFFTEMFDYFRPFFLIVFNVHLLIYVLPICIKFQHDALYAAFLLVGVLGVFKSYPTVTDPGLFLSMAVLFPEIYPYLRHPIVTGLLHLHSCLLLPLFHHLWLGQGTGNANFFYASSLVFACANGLTLTDTIWAGLRVAIGNVETGEGHVEVIQK